MKKQSKNPPRSAFNRSAMLAIVSTAYRLYPTIKDFCVDCHLSPSTFSRYKRGEIDPSLDTVAKMLDKCQIDVQFFSPQLSKVSQENKLSGEISESLEKIRLTSDGLFHLADCFKTSNPSLHRLLKETSRTLSSSFSNINGYLDQLFNSKNYGQN